MIQSDTTLTAKSLEASAKKVFEASAPKILSLQKRWQESDGTPVFTIAGKYTSRGWTEWTEGFVYGSAILQYDATGDESMLQIGREGTLRRMAAQLWATRLAADGVQVIELRPGVMATDMTTGVKDKYDKLIAEGLVPQKRWGKPEDVGLAAKAICRGDFPFSTGDVIYLDGGFHLRRL